MIISTNNAAVISQVKKTQGDPQQEALNEKKIINLVIQGSMTA